MKRGWLLNMGMLVAVVVLAWAAWSLPSGNETGNLPLSAVRPGMAREITLSRPGLPLLQVQRQGQRWMLTAPLRAPADEFQVLRMLTVLDAKPVATLPAEHLDRYELVKPVAILSVDGIEYAFGGINTVTREQYVKRADRIYVVGLQHGAALPAEPAALIRRQLLDENERPLAIDVPGFSLSQRDGKWTVSPPSPGIGQEELQRYVDHWRHAAAAAVEVHSGGESREGTIRIATAGGNTLEFVVLQRQPQLVLWRRDSGLRYRFLEAAGQALLSHPATALKSDTARSN